MYDFEGADATRLAQWVSSDALSEEAIAEHFLRRIESQESAIHAFVSFDPVAVRTQARQLTQVRGKGLLAGIPVGV